MTKEVIAEKSSWSEDMTKDAIISLQKERVMVANAVLCLEDAMRTASGEPMDACEKAFLAETNGVNQGVLHTERINLTNIDAVLSHIKIGNFNGKCPKCEAEVSVERIISGHSLLCEKCARMLWDRDVREKGVQGARDFGGAAYA